MNSLFKIFISILAIFSIAPFLNLESHFKSFMLLSYPPRFLFTFLSILLFGLFKIKNFKFESWFALILFFVNLYFIGFNFSFQNSKPPKNYTAISFNIHNSKENLSDFKSFCKNRKVDFLILQEVKKRDRKHFFEILSDYEFFVMDETKEFEHKDYSPFSSTIGIKKSLLTEKPIVETAITGYRTFATKVKLQEKEFWIANVHTTKSFYLDRKSTFTDLIQKAETKAKWHLQEGILLRSWIESKSEIPVLISGDFNSPYYSENLDFLGMKNAYFEVGNGFHLTFPTIFPIWGIDHTFGNSKINFHSYKTLNLGFSDHKCQLFEFNFGD